MFDRRTFLGGVGAGALAGGTRPLVPPPRPLADLDALAEFVRKTPRGELPGKAAELHRAGTDWRDLLGAAFLAGVRDVEPHPVGFQFHCVMMTASAFQIGRGMPPREQLAAALFNLDDFKLSQQVDARGGDWELGPPAAPPLDGNTAGAALHEALAAWDREAADRAATALARSASLAAAFEPLWWFGMRDFTSIGHNPIFVAQAHRTLVEIGWRHGEDVLRSLVRGLLDGEPGVADATFVANQERSDQPWPLTPGAPSDQARTDLLATLRTADPDAAAAALAEALHGGLAVDSALDAMRLFAVEQLARDPGVLAVHALTSLNALRHAAVHARAPRTRAMALLQAASWLVLYRDFLARRASYDAAAPGIDSIEPAEGPTTPAQAFAAIGEEPARAPALALTAARSDAAGTCGAIRHWLVRKVREHHDYKLAAALLEETDLAAPEVAPFLLAGSVGYLRHPGDRDHPLWQHVTVR